MKLLPAIALFFIALGVSPSEAAWAVAMGADDVPVISSEFRPNADADTSALFDCAALGHPKCKVVGAGKTGCFALAKTDPRSPNPNWSVGMDSAPAAAPVRAIKACAALTADPCPVAVSFCG